MVSVPPLFSQRRRGRGAFIVSVSTQRHLARLFLSLLRLTASEHKARPGNRRGEHVGWCCGVSVLSLPVNLYNLFFLYVWVRIVIYFNVYVCSCIWLFGIDLCFHLYCCRFSFFLFCFVFFFFNREFPYNCYYYYCIVTIVSLFYCIFIRQLWRHVVHYKKKLSLYAYTYIQVTCMYKCMYHDCQVWMSADLNGIFLSMKNNIKCYWGLVFKWIFF